MTSVVCTCPQAGRNLMCTTHGSYAGLLPAPIPMYPTWPEVRCDACKRTYYQPQFADLVRCPHCAGVTFSTSMLGAATTEDKT